MSKIQVLCRVKEISEKISELCIKDVSNELCEELYSIQIILSNRDFKLTNDLIILIKREIN